MDSNSFEPIGSYSIVNAFSKSDYNDIESAFKMCIYEGDTLNTAIDTFKYTFGFPLDLSNVKFELWNINIQDFVTVTELSQLFDAKVYARITWEDQIKEEQSINQEENSNKSDTVFAEVSLNSNNESVTTQSDTILSADAQTFELSFNSHVNELRDEMPKPELMTTSDVVSKTKVDCKEFDIKLALTKDVNIMSIDDLVQLRKYYWDNNERIGMDKIEVELNRRDIRCYDNIQHWVCNSDKSYGNLPGELPIYGGPIKQHWDMTKFNFISDKIFERIRMRLVQDFDNADKIRRELSLMNVQIDDRKEHQSWTLKNSDMWGYTSPKYWNVYSQSSKPYNKSSNVAIKMNCGGGSRGKRRGGYRIK